MEYLLALLLLAIGIVARNSTMEHLQNAEDYLPSPEAFTIGVNKRLVICRANASGPINHLQVKCRKKRTVRRDGVFRSFNNGALLETTRLILSVSKIKNGGRHVTVSCWCQLFYTGKSSKITNLKLRPEPELLESAFLPKWNRNNEVFVNHPVKFTWRIHRNKESFPNCYHDGRPIRKSSVHVTRSKVIVKYRNVSESLAGIYWCEKSGNKTLYSSLMKLHVFQKKKWSRWFTWFKCSAVCGRGMVVESRICLDKERICDGPRVRTMPCIDTCPTNVFNITKNRSNTNTSKSNSTFGMNYELYNTSILVRGKTAVIPPLEVEATQRTSGEDKEQTKSSKMNEIFLITGIAVAVFLCVTCIMGAVRLQRAKAIRQASSSCADYIHTQQAASTLISKIDHSSINTDNTDYHGVAFQQRSVKCYTGEGSTFGSFSRNNDDGEEEAHLREDIVFEKSNEIQRKGSSKSKVSEVSHFSSASGMYCPKPDLPAIVNQDLCAWGLFTEEGGLLKIRNTGVYLYIPKMALPSGTSQVIYIGLMNRKGFYPKLERGQTVLSPVVVCGPDGLHFDKPLCLTVPHNAVVEDMNSWKPKVKSCPTVPEEESRIGQWKTVESSDDEGPPLSHIAKDSLQIMIDHFTGYCVVGQATQIAKWIVPFYTEPKIDRDCSIRIYCIPATKAALEELHHEEKQLNGTVADSKKSLNIFNNNKDVVVTTSRIKEGWEVDETEQRIMFSDLWQTQVSQQRNCFPNVTFLFERVSQDQFSFSSTFKVKQDMENVYAIKVIVVSEVKRSPSPSASLRSLSSGYLSTLSNGCEINAPLKIPLDVRKDLCYYLDVERPDYRDYRTFGEKMGLTNRYLTWLQRSKFPTNDIIEWWENSKSEEIPIAKLIEILELMQRHDAAELLRKIPA